MKQKLFLFMLLSLMIVPVQGKTAYDDEVSLRVHEYNEVRFKLEAALVEVTINIDLKSDDHGFEAFMWEYDIFLHQNPDDSRTTITTELFASSTPYTMEINVFPYDEEDNQANTVTASILITYEVKGNVGTLFIPFLIIPVLAVWTIIKIKSLFTE